MKKRLLFMPIVLLIAGFLLVSCKSRHYLMKPTTIKILVVDFEVPQATETRQKEIRGWWFSSRDVYHNPRAGDVFTDIFARLLNERIPSVEVYSRSDFKYYSANMKDRLRKAYPRLNDKSLDHILSRVSPCDLARDLNLDLVLTAKLNNCYTTHNRFIHWWSSVIDVDITLLDAESGSAAWSAHMDARKHFLSQPSAMEKAAERLIKQMKKEYFSQ